MGGPGLTDRRLRLRLAARQDSELLWHWANDPAVRSNSFNPQPISWEDHVRWFDEVLADADRILLIAEDDDGPLGQIRFDREADGAFEADVSIGTTHRGRGLGAALIRAGVQSLVELHEDVRVRALVLPHNVASSKSFEAAGFKVVDRRDDGTSVLEMLVRRRDV